MIPRTTPLGSFSCGMVEFFAQAQTGSPAGRVIAEGASGASDTGTLPRARLSWPV